MKIGRKLLFKLPVLIFSCFISSLQAQQQTIDSLTNLIKHYPKEDTMLVNLYCELATAYRDYLPDSIAPFAKQGLALAEKTGFETGKANSLKLLAIASVYSANYDKALAYNSMALELYQKMGNLKGEASIYSNVGVIFYNQGKYQESFDYYAKSLQLYQGIGDSAGMAVCYNNMGNSMMVMGKYSDALIYQLKGLHIRELMGDRKAIANSLNNIGGIYSSVNSYEKALEYVTQSLEISLEDQDIAGSIYSYSNAGSACYSMGKYEEALKYLMKGLNLANANGFRMDAGIIELQIGEVYVKTKEYEKAFEYFTKALEHSENLEEIATIHNGLGLALVKTGQVKKGVDHLLKAYNIARSIDYKLKITEITNNLADAYAALGDHRRAFDFKTIQSIYHDSLLNDETQKKIAETQFHYELDKKEHAIELLEKDNALHQKESEHQQFLLTGLAIILLFSVLISVNVVWNNHKEKRSKALILQQKDELERQRVTLEKLNELKDKIFSILSHDLRAPLGSLIGVLSLMEDQSLSREEFDMIKKNLDKQLSSLNMLLDNLLQWSRSYMEGKENLRLKNIMLIHAVQRNFRLFEESASLKNIRMYNEVSTVFLLHADEDQLDFVLRNLLANAVKFTNSNGTIRVSAKEEDSYRVIEVSDNGIGMTDEQCRSLFKNVYTSIGTDGEEGTGLGLLLCKEFIENHNGDIEVESILGKGSTFRVKLPVAFTL